MYSKETINKLNKDIGENFPLISKIGEEDVTTHENVSRLVMLDRYAQKDRALKTLGKGDVVLTQVKHDPTFPVLGIGEVLEVKENSVVILLEEAYRGTLEGEELETGIIERPKGQTEKPLELFYEQIARRVGTNLSEVENEDNQLEVGKEFIKELAALNLVPAGRVLFGAGSGTEVTYFNCFSGDTIIQTKQGAKTFKELVGQEVEVLSFGGEFRPAKIESFGEQELYEVEFDNGEIIEATAGHEWLVSDDRKGYRHDKPRLTTVELEGRRVYRQENMRKEREERLEGAGKRVTSVMVVKVRPTGRAEEVYCGIEPETNTLVVGSGILTGNCYVQPFVEDSREGISHHRAEVMEIMSRGGKQ